MIAPGLGDALRRRRHADDPEGDRLKLAPRSPRKALRSPSAPLWPACSRSPAWWRPLRPSVAIRTATIHRPVAAIHRFGCLRLSQN